MESLRKNGGYRRFFFSNDCRRLIKVIFLLPLLLLLSQCESTAYYQQALRGHLRLSRSLAPIEDVYRSANEQERHKIRLIKSVLLFAQSIGLDHDQQYLSVAREITGPVVWNVYATDAFSIQPKLNCFPLVGCVAYRGYFDKNDAVAYANALKEQGFDTAIQGVSAYSTLGFLDDPVYASFLTFDDLSLARLLFHELAHATVYLSGGAAVNESFATVFEYEALRQWLLHRNQLNLFNVALNKKEKMGRIFLLIEQARKDLKNLYKQSMLAEDKHKKKSTIFLQLKRSYQNLTKQWPDKFYEGWFNRDLNNADLIPMTLYHGKAPIFEEVLRACHDDLLCYLNQSSRLRLSGTEGRTRTDTVLPPPDFESGASTNFATPAQPH